MFCVGDKAARLYQCKALLFLFFAFPISLHTFILRGVKKVSDKCLKFASETARNTAVNLRTHGKGPFR